MQPPRGRTSERTAMVITAGGEIAVALRERLDRAYLTVREVHPTEADAAMAGCAPWPWMVVGAAPELGSGVRAALHRSPVVLLWQGAVPDGLPAHARAFTRFADLVAAAQDALASEVGGIRLAIGSGVSLPGGNHRENAELEALVSLHPEPFDLPLRRFNSAARALAQAGSGWHPGTVPGAGVVLLPPPLPQRVQAGDGSASRAATAPR